MKFEWKSDGKRILIIDTNYYSRIMLDRYDKLVLNSGNLYQIFAYVKNQDKDHTGDVSGLVLYAKTEEEIVPDCSYMMDGNRISVKTLDLNQPFGSIAKQLDAFATETFGMKEIIE